MKHAIIMATAALALVSCSKSSISIGNSVPADGFKQFKYGMSEKQVEAEGFECSGGSYCTSTVPSADRKETLLGHNAMLILHIEDGKLESIDASIDVPQQELEVELTKDFGKPNSFEYSTLSGSRVMQLFWLSAAGTSVSMVNSQSDSVGYAASHGSLSYNDKAETASLLERSKKAVVKSGDF